MRWDSWREVITEKTVAYKLLVTSHTGGSYVQQLSNGGLTVPTQNFMAEGRRLLAQLKELHGDTFGFKKNIIKGTVAHLEQFSTLPKKVLAALAKCFVKFRIVRLNRETRTAKKRRIQETKAKAAAKLRKLL
jgi:polyhydroxyalkanoate synthesis regulator protein